MIPDIGNLLLYIALCLSICTAFVPMIRFDIRLSRVLSFMVFACIIGSFICLIYCYIVSDFSVLNVANNSHTSKPLIYKIVGAWGNHEGSMLLWLSTMSFFTIGFVLEAKEKRLSVITLSIQSISLSIFLSFTIFASNPFLRIFPTPINGLGLNPVLQDIGLAFHPPILYLGYVGFSIVYAMTIALILLYNDKGCAKEILVQYTRSLKIWTLVAWFFLTVGIALGSWWAYRELGWGGYWFWDPVENASLIPWLSATALLHAIAVYKKTGLMQRWVMILSLSTFIFSILGTFLVRSGVVTSVHSFATDPSRGVVILSILAIHCIAAILIYLYKLPNAELKNYHFNILSKFFFININNLFLSVAVFTILLGTIYPMVLELLNGTKISVGPPYFNKVFNPLLLALAGLCAIGSGLPWHGRSKNMRNYVQLGFACIITAFISYYNNIDSAFEIVGITVGFWLCIATIVLYYRNILQNASYSRSMILAHLGFGIIVLSISLNTALNNELRQAIKIGETVHFMNNKIKLIKVFYEKRSNHIAQIALLKINYHNQESILQPEIQFFATEQQQTIEAAIEKRLFHDLYIVVDGIYNEDGTYIQIYYKPMMSWLWFGAFLLAMAAILATFGYKTDITKE